MNSVKQIFLSKRIGILFVCIAMLISFCGCEGGEGKTDKVYKVGILSGLDYLSAAVDGFKEELTKLGYIEGQNIEYDVQKTNSDFDDYKKFSQKFVDDKVDLVFLFSDRSFFGT
ncbi:MAG TPA: hypothetical protein PK566_09000 [Pseudobacteroides sp.]|nr:hypothetical protein [Pseudobacteroides sp.]